MRNTTQKLQQTRRGGMLPMVALVMVILLIGAAFSVDIAYMHMVRAELRTATDAAARAGTETLSRTQDAQQAINAALQIAQQNSVSGEGLVLDPNDIIVGGVEEQGGKFVFVPGRQPFSSVRVTGRRDGSSPGGRVPLFFGSIFGRSNFGPIQEATATASVRDIALVLDRSGSMNARDAGGGLSRNQALIAAVNDFISEVAASSPNSFISVTTYSTSSTRDLALTENFQAARDVVNALPASGATNIFQGLQQGSDSLVQDPLNRPFAEKTIVLMTDGNFNVGGTPVPSANNAAARGHTIHTVTFSGGANQGIMAEVARIGDGEHHHADNAADLKQVFRDIARTLSVLLVE